MSSPDDIQAQLRASAPVAPDALRDRVQTIVAREGARRRPVFTRRRASLALVGALGVAAIGAAFVHGLSSGTNDRSATPAQRVNNHATASLHSLNAATSTTAPEGAGAVPGAAATVGKRALQPPLKANTALAPSQLPPAGLRLQNYDVSLGVRVKDSAALSSATVQAMRWTRAYGGFVARVSYDTPGGRKGEADLVLRVPVGKVQDALQRFSALGTLTSQHVAIQDLQGTVNAQTKRIIELNRRIGTILAALETPLTSERRAQLQYELSARRQELAALTGAKRATVQQGRFAHVYLTLTTQAKHKKAVAPPHRPGSIERRLDAAGHVLAQELAMLLYALVILAPFILLGAAGLAVARTARKRTDRRLLARS